VLSLDPRRIDVRAQLIGGESVVARTLMISLAEDVSVLRPTSTAILGTPFNEAATPMPRKVVGFASR